MAKHEENVFLLRKKNQIIHLICAFGQLSNILVLMVFDKSKKGKSLEIRIRVIPDREDPKGGEGSRDHM